MRPASAILDERSRRRPDFIEGEPIMLMDGQTWEIPRPRVRVDPLPCEAGLILSPRYFFPGVMVPELDTLFRLAVDCSIERWCRATVAGDDDDGTLALIAMGSLALHRNYVVSDHEVTDLILGGAAEDPQRFLAMWQELKAVLITAPREEFARVSLAIPYREPGQYASFVPAQN